MKKLYLGKILLLLTLVAQTSYSHETLDVLSQFLRSSQVEYVIKRSFKQNRKKKWTIVIYMAADNDLAPFARKNLIQLARNGSSAYVNIIVHLDILLPGKKKTTLRYYVEKNKLIVTNHNDAATQKMDSGKPETLISALKWAIQDFPSDHIMLDLWNHGIGCLDVGRPRTINPSELFVFNSSSNMLDLDRSIPFLEFITLTSQVGSHRGICFDDSTGNYLNNQDLIHALSTVQKKHLHGKKVDVICFDACLMAMLEIANLLRGFADFMVASQEVELGSGYDYERLSSPFQKHAPDPKSFAKHIVQEYGNTYARITNDYTQSAVELAKIAELEKSIDSIAKMLIEALRIQKNQSVKNAIKTSRHKLLCTHFDEPSYIDLHHFLVNLASNLHRFSCNNQQKESAFKAGLKKEINRALKLIKAAVLANAVGKNLKQAGGISIYFPEIKMHSSYRRIPFASQNQWAHFLARYILS